MGLFPQESLMPRFVRFRRNLISIIYYLSSILYSLLRFTLIVTLLQCGGTALHPHSLLHVCPKGTLALACKAEHGPARADSNRGLSLKGDAR